MSENIKEITYNELEKECTPHYIIEYNLPNSIITHTRKFKNPQILKQFINTLKKQYTYKIYKTTKQNPQNNKH